MIRVADLSKSYNGERCLSGISFSVAPGEFVSLMGKSGSGKTTLLEILCGVRRADSGSLSVVGENVLALGERELALFRRTKIGVVYQSFSLLPTLTAEENIALPLLLRGEPARARRDAILAAAEALGIAECLPKYPRELSGGQMQRVAIARASVYRPPLLLLDEPTGALDVGNTERTLAYLDSLRREHGITVFQITHDRGAAEHGTRILMIRDGEIVQ